MAKQFGAVAFASVIAAGITLLTIGHRAAEAAPGVSVAGFTLVPVSVDLPVGDRGFPPGPGLETVQGNCVTCHSAGMVLNQPALTRATWEAEVNKMRAIYKAPVPAEDVATIVTYLATVKGKS